MTGELSKMPNQLNICWTKMSNFALRERGITWGPLQPARIKCLINKIKVQAWMRSKRNP